jgi:hypothetical protein
MISLNISMWMFLKVSGYVLSLLRAILRRQFRFLHMISLFIW